ncbi:MAG: indolepyruvate oxidoreductase subunit beta [bacterium]
MKTNQSILICGIGGQGVVLSGKIISLSAFYENYDVKTSEVHGMSQRGGSVSTHLKYGEKIFTPLISLHSADIILSFDLYETMRYIGYANKETKIITASEGKYIRRSSSDQIKLPSPESIINKIKIDFNFKNLFAIDIEKIAGELGNIKVANTVLIGASSQFTYIKEQTWLNILKENVPAKTIDINEKAFLLGRKILN